MRIPPMISEFFEWRWAPCVGLTAGSLAFVALAVSIIPAQFAGSSSSSSSNGVSDVRSFERPVAAAPPPQRALFGASLARDLTGSVAQRISPPVASPEPRPPPQPMQEARGFSPIADRPDPPPPPPPPQAEAAPAPPPLAPPEPAVVIQQPEPDGPRREVAVP